MGNPTSGDGPGCSRGWGPCNGRAPNTSGDAILWRSGSFGIALAKFRGTPSVIATQRLRIFVESRLAPPFQPQSPRFRRGLFYPNGPYIPRVMSVRPRTRPKPQPRVSKFAHDAALHFLARPKQYPLTDAERADLIQVAEVRLSRASHARRMISHGARRRAANGRQIDCKGKVQFYSQAEHTLSSCRFGGRPPGQIRRYCAIKSLAVVPARW